MTQSLSLTRDSYENWIRSTTQTALSLNHLIQCLNFSTGKQLRAFILHQRRTTALFIHNFPQQCCFSIPHTFRNCPKKPRTSWQPRTSLPQDDDPSTTLSTLHFRPYFSWSPAQSNVLDRKVYICDGCLSCRYIPRRLALTTQQLQQQLTGFHFPIVTLLHINNNKLPQTELRTDVRTITERSTLIPLHTTHYRQHPPLHQNKTPRDPPVGLFQNALRFRPNVR